MSTVEEHVEEAAACFRAALLNGSAAHIADALARVRRALLVVKGEADVALLLAREELAPMLTRADVFALALGALERVRAKVLAPGGAAHSVLLGCSVDVVECSAIQDAARVAAHLHYTLAKRLESEAHATARALVDRVVDRGAWPQAWLAGAATALDADCSALVAALRLREDFALATSHGALAGEAEGLREPRVQDDSSLICNALLLLRSLVRRSELDAARAMVRRLHAAARATRAAPERALCNQLDELDRGMSICLAQRDVLRYCTGEGSPFVRCQGDAGTTAEAAAASAAAALRAALNVQSAVGTGRAHPREDGAALAHLRATVAAAQNEVELFIAMLDEDWPNARRWLARFEAMRRQSATATPFESETARAPPLAPPRWLAATKVDLLLHSCLEPVRALLAVKSLDLGALDDAVAVALEALAQLPRSGSAADARATLTIAEAAAYAKLQRITKAALLTACEATPPSTAELERALASAARSHGTATPEVQRARALITSIDGAEAALNRCVYAMYRDISCESYSHTLTRSP